MYGRDAELDRLRSYLDDALAGHGRLVLVGGEAGIGKTTLLGALARDAVARAVLVLSGGCYDLAPTPPYGPWLELLRSFTVSGSTSAGLSPGANGGERALPPGLAALADLDVAGVVAGQDTLFMDAGRAFADWSARQPLLILLEDLHWADEASLSLLRFVTQRIRAPHALFVASYRDAELARDAPLYRALPQLAREPRVERVALRPLAGATVRRIVADRYGLAAAAEDALAGWLDRLAEGNPFFVAELLHTLEHEVILRRGDQGWELGDLRVVDVPPLVRQVIDTRLGWLDGSALALLQVAAVIGLELPLRLWHAVAAVEDDELANAVEQAQSAALIEELPDRPGYRFRHALVREALYHSLVLPRRRTQHRRVAENLAAQPGADPDAVAYHFRQAGDARAAEWLIRAAERANRAFAFVIAAERYEQALALLGPDDAPPAERGWLLCELAMAYRFADPRRALRYLDDATAIAERVGDAGLRLAVLWARTVTRGLRGERTLDDVLRAADIYAQLSADDRDHLTEDRGHVTPGWGWLAFQLARHGAYDAAARLAERQIDERGASASRRARGETARALAALGLVWAGTGRPEQAREAFARSRALADELGDRHLVSLTITWELMELVLAYHADQPSARHQLNAAAAASWGQLIAFSAPDASSPDMTVFAALLLDGRWDVADAQATDDLERDSLRVDALRLLCELERRRGNVDRARTHLQAALSDGPATRPSTFYFYSILWLQRTGAELALDDGRPDDARPWIEAHDRWLDWSGRVLDRAAGRLLWSRYHLARGEHEHALAHARAALERASEPRQPLALLAAHRDLGRLARLDGDSEGAARHLTEALALAGACAAPYERALVLVERAELAVATGDAAAARADLGEVRALCAPLAAAPLLARAATLQSRLGEGPTPGDVLGLSAREVEVLRLVARGLTDAEVAERLFISPRTVSGHLRSIFSKLDVGSRTAASAIAFERGIV